VTYDAKSDSGGTVSEFTNAKYVVITTNGISTPINYQVKLTVPYEDEMQTSFQDIRFNTASGDYIDYWIESHTDSTTAIVWLELPDPITDPGTGTIYMYYGNAELSDGSNIGDTFIFGDDFSGDLSKWTVRAGMSIINNELNMPANVNSDRTPTYGNTNLGTSYIWEFKAKVVPGTRLQPIPIYLGDYTEASNKTMARILTDVWGGINNIYEVGVWGDVGTFIGTVVTIDNTYHKWKLIRKPTSFMLYIDGNLIGNEHSVEAEYNTTSKIAISGYNTAAVWDDIFVRKYIANEPTYEWVVESGNLIICGRMKQHRGASISGGISAGKRR